jgi:hypothetical protein
MKKRKIERERKRDTNNEENDYGTKRMAFCVNDPCPHSRGRSNPFYKDHDEPNENSFFIR